ncbi:hypothetical protein EON64_07685 [archaeon]|nr:MAG: hypothetical protein EON64_07685 [archaeon]
MARASLIRAVEQAVSIPAIASSGAGNAAHFVDVLQGAGVQAALAACFFKQKEVSIREVKAASAVVRD